MPIKTPRFLKPLFGELLFRKEPEKVMTFPVTKEGLRYIKSMPKAPGIYGKYPFVHKEFALPEGMVEQTLKTYVEMPEKIATSLRELPHIYKTGEVPKYKKPYRVPSYTEDYLTLSKEFKKIDVPYPRLAAGLLTGGTAVIDVAIVGSFIDMGAKAILARQAVSPAEVSAARQSMGLSKKWTIAEREKQFKNLAHITHPDMPTGSHIAFKRLNSANQILTKAEAQPVLMREAGRLAAKLEQPVSKLGVPAGKPYMGVKGLLPEKAGTMPVEPYQPVAREIPLGLTIKKAPIKPGVKPIPKELEAKAITEMRTTKGFINPKNVPTERLSVFDNFINLNKIKRTDVPYKKMGIAEIVRDGKSFPAIRQKSGFYATKDIQTAPIRDVYNQTLSPYHMALKQDSYKLGGEFGTMFKKVWKPTEKAIRGQKEFTNVYFKTIKDISKKYKIKATKKNLEHLSDVIEKKVKATPQEKVFIKEIRGVLDDLRSQANDIRVKMRRDEIGYITDYIPHLQKTSLWNELLSNVATISDNLDFIIPNQVRNPFAFHRLLQEMPKAERNLYVLLDRYIRAISKDIYITPAIENIKAYNSVLKNRELLNASKYWDEYIRVGLIGKQHKLDAAMSIGQTGRKGLQKWNNMVNKAFLTGKVAWNIATQPLSYIMNVPMEAGIINSVKAIYKSFGKGLRQYVKENSNVLAIKSKDVRAVAIGEGRNIQNRIYQTKISKWNDFLSMLGSVEERELTLTSYIAGLERAKDLGYKGQDALDFADLTAARTQSMYNKENRALILDSDVARFAFPFQSFSVEMYNHILEIGTKKGAESLKARQRLGKLFRLLVGVYSANLYSKVLTGRKKTTIGTFFPFVGNYIDLLVSQVMGESYYGGRSPMTVIQIGQDVIRGSKDFIKHGNINRLRKVAVNFGLALGGIGGGGQINNIIDGIMADVNEEVKNVSGDTMFEVKDALSKVIAPFFGVWATKEGREYFEPKKEKEWWEEVPPKKKK